MLKKEFTYYLNHQSDLVSKYNGKFIVLKDEKIIGVYSSHSEAYNEVTDAIVFSETTTAV